MKQVGKKRNIEHREIKIGYQRSDLNNPCLDY